MNESETRAEYIDPKLKASGWGEIEGSKVLREYRITEGRIQSGGTRAKPEIADYVLVYKGQKLAVVEAKQLDLPPTEGVQQAKAYSEKMQTDYAYSTNGKEIYQIYMRDGKEEYVDNFPTPVELWNKVFSDQNLWKEKFAAVNIEGNYGKRYYQEIAVSRALNAIAEDKSRLLLTLATGTGKTVIAFQVIWKLYQTRWNLQKNGGRRPRILFLADRNILADQAYNSFSTFPEDALVRINPLDIRRKGGVPTTGNIFFTIFQTFMSGAGDTPYFGGYPKDFFDLIVIDECHRGGANDEGNWRSILEYFSPAVQIGLTATPKRKDNVDTYRYFGEPIYTYSLKEGINDGFLTPFKVRRIQTTLDEYVYTSDDQIIEGEVEEGKIYKEDDFNKIIEIKEREAKRIKVLMEQTNQNEKTIVFCANQEHALAIRDLINQIKTSQNPNYCVRVTANDGARGEQFLRDFQDNEKTIPTVLTTSQKLSTGVDARNIRNIVLMRPINSMIEFKQIVGRGTRLFDGKYFFTIIDFVNAYHHFSDPEWDGEPIEPVENATEGTRYEPKEKDEDETIKIEIDTDEGRPKRLKIKLRDGKEREIQHMTTISFWGADGKPISEQEFIEKLFGVLPDFFKSENELKEIWGNPVTRKKLLSEIENKGYDQEEIESVQKMIGAEDSDIFDVLSYILFLTKPISRTERIAEIKNKITENKNEAEKEFVEFILKKYEIGGSDELSEEKLPTLLKLKYHSAADAEDKLGGVDNIRSIFFDIQRMLYS